MTEEEKEAIRRQNRSNIMRNPGDEETDRRTENQTNDPEAPKADHLNEGRKNIQNYFRKRIGL